MELPDKNKITLNELLSFAMSRGVELTDEAIDILRERLEEEPITKATLKRSKFLAKNPLAKQIIELTFLRRIEKIKEIEERNPVLRLINKRKSSENGRKDIPLPKNLREVFYDEERWQPFYPLFGIPARGKIVKAVDPQYPDKPFIAHIATVSGETMIRSTKRFIPLETLKDAKYFRIKDGLFDYEKNEVLKLENEFFEYIKLFFE